VIIFYEVLNSARGFVTIEDMIRRYVKYQEGEERKVENNQKGSLWLQP
jgi:hypothetical protein